MSVEDIEMLECLCFQSAYGDVLFHYMFGERERERERVREKEREGWGGRQNVAFVRLIPVTRHTIIIIIITSIITIKIITAPNPPIIVSVYILCRFYSFNIL